MGSRKVGNRRITIRVTVVGMFLIATLITALIAISLQYRFSKQMAAENAVTEYRGVSEQISSYIKRLDREATYTAELLGKIMNESEYNQSFEKTRSIFAQAMNKNPLFYSLYVGYDNENFYQLINLNSAPIVRERIRAISSDRWVLIKISNIGNQRIKETLYYDANFNIRHKKSEKSNYYPTQRPWYSAQGKTEVDKTLPYLFQHLKIPGQTYSIGIPESKAVLGIDIVLSSVESELAKSSIVKRNSQHLTEGEVVNERDSSTILEAYIYRKNGEVIASNQSSSQHVILPPSKILPLTAKQQSIIADARSFKVSNQNDWAPMDFSLAGQPQGYSVDTLGLVSEMTGLRFEFINGFSWNELLAKYQSNELDMLHSLQNNKMNQTLGVFSQPMYELSFGIVTNTGVDDIKTLTELNGKRLAILDGWSVIPQIKKQFPSIQLQVYPSVRQAIEAVKSGDADAVIDSQVILSQVTQQYFIEELQAHNNIVEFQYGFSDEFHLVMKEPDHEIVNIINQALANITPEQKEALKLKWLSGPETRSPKQSDLVVPYAELMEIADQPTQQHKLVLKDIAGESKYIFVSDVGVDVGSEEYFAVVIPQTVIYSVAKSKVVTSVLLTAGFLSLFLPLSWFFGSPIVKPIARLREQSAKIKNRQYDDVQLVETQVKELWELSVSIKEMSCELKRHEEAQEEFVESFIRLIAQAIDDKSPYTAGHCNRVPELGIMLSEAAEKSESGPFKSFAFANDDERREFRIAAWLHDCGKITTPEHIVDKGTKLEASYNRIHEVRMRFEVLWRDAEIETLKQLALEPHNHEILMQKLKRDQQQLVDDFAFVASANVGSEFMNDESIERIHDLASKTWTRYFDDRLGLSPIEELACEGEASPFPVTETLLADKAEHIIKRSQNVEFDPQFNIKMDVPEHQYNLGEIYNLTVKRGTLTAEDRFKINEHMISTIKMLENLPFPPELARVPRYASTHHETLKGTGYPRRLTGDQLSVPERILVIADIFEALTAADRPYKKAKPISVAVNIMYKMALDDHLDIELFRLFLASGTYLRYAKEYLRPEQIDHVDISQYLDDELAA
ncbi:phosphohydrolase [Vibrionales bacterium C3R12]|nr:phosphohydrolase [Vibrionales bacterium C3R12]